MKSKKKNYELLRIISLFAIIILHISGFYLGAITSPAWLGDIYTKNMLFNCIINALTRFAVPCFIMISGAFALDNIKNSNYKYYYNKIFKRVILPTILFSIFYFFYLIFRKAFILAFSGDLINEIISFIKLAIVGQPFYHMWYLYMMVGVFLLTPIVIKFKQDIGEKSFKNVTIVFFIISMLGLLTSNHMLEWDPGKSFCYLSYFMMGYVIRKNTKKEKSNKKSIILIILGFLILLGAGFLRYKQGLNGISEDELTYALLQPFSPLPILASLLIFAGFTKLSFNKDVTKLSALTFEIFLFHAGILDLLKLFVKLNMNSILVIIVISILTFIISLILALIYKKIRDYINNKYHIDDRITKLLKLH